jgi:hypothetical protein
MKNPKHRSLSLLDDTLCVLALVISLSFAAARYVDSEREMTALAKLQQTHTTAVVEATTAEERSVYGDRIAWRMKSDAAQISTSTP